jgi:branched-chain amino acid transport system permease protein
LRNRPTRWRELSPLARHLVVALACLALVVVVIETAGSFRQGQLSSMAYLAIAAGGLTVLTGQSGQLSLGHGAFMAVGAYTTALLLQSRESAPPLLAVLVAATVVTLVVGIAVGIPAARLHGPYIAGATLALAVAVPGAALYFSEQLGGEQGLTLRVPEPPAWIVEAMFFVTGRELTGRTYVAYVAWLSLVVTYLLLADLGSSRVGRRWRAVRDDEVAAAIAGINLGRARVLAFVVSAAAAGLAGAVMALVVRVTAPSGFTLTLSLGLLSAIVLGGLGSLLGALLGAALLTFLPQVVTSIGQGAGLSDLQAAELAPLVYGLTVVVVMLLAPGGLVGTLRSRVTHRRRPS